MVYRNYYFSTKRDKQSLKKHWNSSVEAMQYLQQFDTNGDFIPENSGFPDHTYDSAWHMKGLSAYCGGLWLAALDGMIEMGKILNEASLVKQYQHWLETGKESFHKILWNGEYYDCYEGCNDVMADQLCGQWYADLLGLPPIDKPEYIVKAYKSIFKYNCLNYFGGERGVVTGITTEGIIPDEEQTPEAILCENITPERLERAYKFARLKRGDDWKPPRNFTAEYLRDSKVLQMRAPQYSRPMASSVFLYVFEKLINKNK